MVAASAIIMRELKRKLDRRRSFAHGRMLRYIEEKKLTGLRSFLGLNKPTSIFY